MTTFLRSGDALLRLPSARIPAEDVGRMRDAMQLLEEVRSAREEAEQDSRRLRSEARREGREEAFGELVEGLANALQEFADGTARENARREAAVADAALRATQRLIGIQANEDIAAGLAREALSHTQGGRQRVVVGPGLGGAVRERLADVPDIEVMEDSTAGAFACRVETPHGTVIADLDAQLATLAERWGATTDG